MVQIQLDLDTHTDKNLKIYMAYNGIKRKTDAIRYILSEYFMIRPPKFEADIVTNKKVVLVDSNEEVIERGSHIIHDNGEEQ